VNNLGDLDVVNTMLEYVGFEVLSGGYEEFCLLGYDAV
jgi:hypothetical protein